MSNILNREDLTNFKAVACISAAQKYIIDAPTKNTEPLVFPQAHPKAGSPITDYQGNPVGDSGIVFFNYKDNVVQAVADGIIIINQVSAAQAAVLDGEIAKIGGNPKEFTLAQTKQVLAKAAELGLGDQYNSDYKFKKDNLTPIGLDKGFGLFKRDARDLCEAYVMTGSGSFHGDKVGEPQAFIAGDVILRQPDGKGGSTERKIDGKVFQETYTHPDGSAITLMSTPVAGLAKIASKLAGAHKDTTPSSAPKTGM